MSYINRNLTIQLLILSYSILMNGMNWTTTNNRIPINGYNSLPPYLSSYAFFLKESMNEPAINIENHTHDSSDIVVDSNQNIGEKLDENLQNATDDTSGTDGAQSTFYSCNHCKKQFYLKKELRDHHLLDHTIYSEIIESSTIPEKMITCNFIGCNQEIHSLESTLHKFAHHTTQNDTLYLCLYPLCNTKENRKKIIDHFNRKHNNFLFRCPECKSLYSDLYSFHQHKFKAHTGLICAFCKKKLKTVSYMNHLTSIHKMSKVDAKNNYQEMLKTINL